MIVFEAGQLKPGAKEELIRRLTEVSVEVTGIPAEYFLVAIHELPDGDIGMGGKTVAEIKRRLAEQQP
jgi:4-oxalocrotonate tautomerase